MASLDPDFTLFIHSANGLKKVNLFSNMTVYAVASVAGDTSNGNQETKTPIVKDGGTNPQWKSHAIHFTVPEFLLLYDQLTLNIKLVSERTLTNTKIGKAEIPLKELLDRMGGGDAQRKQIKQVRYGIRPQGTINFGYIFGDKFWVSGPPNNSHDPVMASPVGYPGSNSGYAPASHAGPYPPAQAYSYAPPGAYPPPPRQQPGYGYAPRPQAGYGYPPQPGYGYPVQQVLQGALLSTGIGNNLDQMAAAHNAGGYDAGFGGYDAGFGGYDAGFDAGFAGFDAGFGG